MVSPAAIALCQRRIAANATVGCVLIALCVLAFLPPDRFAIYPSCPVRDYLGLLCPGCGATHALSTLLRGHILEALHQNALFVLLLPFALFYAARTYLRAIRHGDFYWPRIPSSALAAMLLATAAFTVVRNLPH